MMLGKDLLGRSLIQIGTWTKICAMKMSHRWPMTMLQVVKSNLRTLVSRGIK